eukprot:gene3148-3937_t
MIIKHKYFLLSIILIIGIFSGVESSGGGVYVDGIASGTLNVVTSSNWDAAHTHLFCRLNYRKRGGEVIPHASGWAAAFNNLGQYIIAASDNLKKFTHVKIQGRGDPMDNQYVKSFTLEYSVDGMNFIPYKNNMVFNGNIDYDSIVTIELDPQPIARSIKLIPKTWNNHISLRWDVTYQNLPTSFVQSGQVQTDPSNFNPSNGSGDKARMEQINVKFNYNFPCIPTVTSSFTLVSSVDKDDPRFLQSKLMISNVTDSGFDLIIYTLSSFFYNKKMEASWIATYEEDDLLKFYNKNAFNSSLHSQSSIPSSLSLPQISQSISHAPPVYQPPSTSVSSPPTTEPSAPIEQQNQNYNSNYNSYNFYKKAPKLSKRQAKKQRQLELRRERTRIRKEFRKDHKRLQHEVKAVFGTGISLINPLWPRFIKKSDRNLYSHSKVLPHNFTEEYIDHLDDQIQYLWEHLKPKNSEPIPLTNNISNVLNLTASTMLTDLLNNMFFKNDLKGKKTVINFDDIVESAKLSGLSNQVIVNSIKRLQTICPSYTTTNSPVTNSIINDNTLEQDNKNGNKNPKTSTTTTTTSTTCTTPVSTTKSSKVLVTPTTPASPSISRNYKSLKEALTACYSQTKSNEEINAMYEEYQAKYKEISKKSRKEYLNSYCKQYYQSDIKTLKKISEEIESSPEEKKPKKQKLVVTPTTTISTSPQEKE